MKRTFSKTLALLFISLVITTWAKGQILQAIPLLTVTGEATIKMTPDYAIIAVEAERVLSANDLSAASASFLFNDADIQVKMVSSEDNEVQASIPFTRLQNNSGILIKAFTITVNNIAKLQDVIIDLTRRNIGRISYVSYRCYGLDALYLQARRQAIMNAKSRATAYAEALAQTIGKANTVKEEVMDVYNWFESVTPNGNDTRGEKYIVNPGYVTIYCKVSVGYDLVK